MSNSNSKSAGTPEGPTDFRGGLVVLSGPSGSGKTSICRSLLRDPRVSLSVSGTTRSPREGESDGVDYHFFTRADFEAAVARGDFAEWAEVYGHRYGTLKAPLLRASGVRDRMLLLDIDVQGAAQLQKVNIPAFYVFIAPPSLEDLRHRLRKRDSDSAETIERRLRSAEGEMARQDLYDKVLVNRDLEATIQSVRQLLGLPPE